MCQKHVRTRRHGDTGFSILPVCKKISLVSLCLRVRLFKHDTSFFYLNKLNDMIANENSINNLESLVKEIKKYIGLQGEYLRLDVVEKLTVLLSTLILILVLTILGMMALFYFSFMLVYALVPIVGSIIGSYAIIGGVILLLALLVYRMRKQWIFQPIVNFLARLFLEDSADKHKQ